LPEKIEGMKKLLEGQFKRQVGATFFTQLMNLILAIINAAIIARWLGPEGKGIIALVMLVPGLLGLFLSGGVSAANVYLAGSRSRDIPSLTENSVKFALLSTIIGIFIVITSIGTGWLSRLVPGINNWLIMLAMVGLPIGLLNGHLSAVLQGLQRILTVNKINLTQALTTVALTVLFVMGFGMDLSGPILSSLAAGMIGLALLIIVLSRAGGVFKPRWNPSGMGATLSFGLRGHLGNLFQFFNYRLDTFFVNYFIGAGEVGIYSVSVGLAELLWYLPNAVGFVIFPKATATKPEVLRAFTPRVFWITLGITALGAIGLVILGKSLIQVVYSLNFVGAYLPMLVLLPGVILLGGAKVLTNEIAGRGYPQYNSLNAGIALILTVILDLILIPRFGILGAALASSIAYTAIFFASVGFYLFVRGRITEFNPERYKQEIK
jgi:O-antigen/teichoic acid export membrane protein